MIYCVVFCKHESEGLKTLGFKIKGGYKNQQRETFEKWCESFGYEIITFNMYPIDLEVTIGYDGSYARENKEEKVS